MYWNSEVEDRDADPTSEDLYFKGPWYSYPMGIGYLIRWVKWRFQDRIALQLFSLTNLTTTIMQLESNRNVAQRPNIITPPYELSLGRRHDRVLDSFAQRIS